MFSFGLGKLGGNGVPSDPFQVLVDENGTPALVDCNFEIGRFWYSGAFYSSFAAMLTAMGTSGQANGDGTYTIGPKAGGQPFTGYNASAGTIVAEWESQSQTQSLFVYTIQAASNANYWRRLTIDGSNRPVMQVNNGSVAQASINGPAGAEETTFHRFRACDVMATNDFSSHVNGEIIDPANPDTSGLVSGVSVSVSVQIGHRAGAGKLIGTMYRWAYFPRAVSAAQRYKLSQPAQAQSMVVPGVRTFFSSPMSVKVGSDVFAGAITQQHGSIVVGKPGAVPFYLKNALQRDDHDNPALLRLSSGKILAAYCRHALDDNFFVRRTTNVDDMTAWDAEVDLGTTPFASGHYTYANIVEIMDGIFIFMRADVPDDSYYTWHYTKSTDGGSTWAAVQQLWAEPGNRSYSQFCKGGPNRIDAICNDGHPNEFVGNSTYHAYYLAGAWYKSDGTALGALPYRPSASLTRIWDGASVESWVWGVQWDGSTLASVFATFPDSALDHRYQYARWSGSAWIVNEICTAGGSFDINGGAIDEKFYSGGVCLDPDNVSIIYCSREVGTGGPHRNGGTFQLFKGVTADGGATWTLTQLTFGSEDAFRPEKVKGSDKLAYQIGEYTDYRNVSTTRVQLMTV